MSTEKPPTLESLLAERGAVIAAMGGYYGATGGKSLPDKVAILATFAQRKCLERMEANTARYAAEAALDKVRAVASGMQDGPSGIPEIDTMRAEVVRLRAEAAERHGKLRNVKAALAGVLDEFGSIEGADDVPPAADNGYMPAHQWGHDCGRAALADLRQQIDDAYLASAMVCGRKWPSEWRRVGPASFVIGEPTVYQIALTAPRDQASQWALYRHHHEPGGHPPRLETLSQHDDPLVALRVCQAIAG